MGLLESLNLEAVPDMTTVSAGEYEVEITSSTTHTSQEKGTESIKVTFSILQDANAWPVTTYFGLPNGNDTEAQANNKKRRIKEFIAAFKVSDTDHEEWVGSTGWVSLGVEVYQGREKNTFSNALVVA